MTVTIRLFRIASAVCYPLSLMARNFTGSHALNRMLSRITTNFTLLLVLVSRSNAVFSLYIYYLTFLNSLNPSSLLEEIISKNVFDSSLLSLLYVKLTAE